MIKSLDQYWSVRDTTLYPRDEYYRNHTLDVREFLEVGVVVSVLATAIIFFLGFLMVVL